MRMTSSTISGVHLARVISGRRRISCVVSYFRLIPYRELLAADRREREKISRREGWGKRERARGTPVQRVPFLREWEKDGESCRAPAMRRSRVELMPWYN